MQGGPFKAAHPAGHLHVKAHPNARFTVAGLETPARHYDAHDACETVDVSALVTSNPVASTNAMKSITAAETYGVD
jgi:hypothetical protein